MARRPGANSEETRSRILDAAFQLFALRSYGEVTTRAIAKDAGCNPALIHHYFGDKQSLYVACIQALYGRLAGLMTELVPVATQSMSRRDRVAELVRRSFRFAVGQRLALRMLVRVIAERTAAEGGERERLQAPALEHGAAMIAAALGMSAIEARLALQTCVAAIVRFAIATPTELALFTDVADDPIGAIEHHLVETSQRVFGVAA